MTLPRPVKSVLQDAALDAPISRGWSRIQRKRRVRDSARKSALAVSCLALAVAVGWAVRPLFPLAKPVLAPAVAVVRSAGLDSLVQALPKTVRGRSPAVQRPVPVVVPAPAEPLVKLPQPEVDVVAALLESVREAYDVGDTARATALLSEISEKHSEDPRAAQALYVLGLIQLEKNKDAKGAADSFTHALELAPPPELVPTLWQALERARAAQ